MTDDDAFLAAIRAAPDDDAPRLVYADWLDEHAQPERAQFIRRQLHNFRNDGGRSFLRRELRRPMGMGFKRLVGLEAWHLVRPDHVSPMIVFTTSTYGICVAWHRGFPAVVGCTEGQWREYRPLFRSWPLLAVCMNNYDPNPVWTDDDRAADSDNVREFTGMCTAWKLNLLCSGKRIRPDPPTLRDILGQVSLTSMINTVAAGGPRRPPIPGPPERSTL